MALWSPKKRNDTSAEQLAAINANLKISFSRIRADIEAIKEWLHYFQTTQEQNNGRFETIESRVDELGAVLAYMEEAPKGQAEIFKEDPRSLQPSPMVEEEPEMEPKLLAGMTETQKLIFFRMGTLLKESGQEWIAIKALAQELYPEKAYDQVRSTVSEYLAILAEAGIVKKKRVGKITFIALTTKGATLFPQVKTEEKLTPITKRKTKKFK